MGMCADILQHTQQDIFTQVSTLIVHYEAQHLHNIMVLMLSNGAKKYCITEYITLIITQQSVIRVKIALRV